MPIRRAVAGFALVSLGIAPALSGCQLDQPAAAPAGRVTIALLAEQRSGAGEQAAWAAQLAVDLINGLHPEVGLPLAGSAGLRGLAGAPLVLVVADTDGEPGSAETAMEEAVAREQPVGFVAADSAEVVATAGAYADRRGLPLVDGATSAGFLLEVGLDWYFRVTPSDRMLAEAVFGLLGDAPIAGDREVTLLAPAGGAAELVGLLVELSRASDLEIATTVTVDDGEQSGGVVGAAARLAESTPDPVIAIATTAAEAATLQQVLAQAGSPRLVVGVGRGFRPAPDPAPPGLVYPAAWSPEFAERHPHGRAIAELYQQRHDTPMTEAAAGVFTATLTLAIALDAARAADPAAVRAALRQLSLPATQMIMPWQGVRFGDDGQNALAAAVLEQHTQSGPVLVYPPELAAADPQWPPAAGGAP
jgi:branched-chain amino acid transport system substrate-binding protein